MKVGRQRAPSMIALFRITAGAFPSGEKKPVAAPAIAAHHAACGTAFQDAQGNGHRLSCLAGWLHSRERERERNRSDVVS